MTRDWLLDKGLETKTMDLDTRDWGLRTRESLGTGNWGLRTGS